MKSGKSKKHSLPASVSFASVPEFLEAAAAPPEPDEKTISTAGTGTSVRTIEEAMADTLLGYIDKNADTYLQDFEISDSDDENVCEGRPSKSLKAMLKAFDEVPMSTAFSGIDAPGTGLCQQLSELNSRVGEGHQRNKIAKPLHLNAIEWFQPSQSELLCHPCKPHCLFGDITMSLTPFLRGLFPQLVLKQKLMEVLKPVISLPESIVLKLVC